MKTRNYVSAKIELEKKEEKFWSWYRYNLYVIAPCNTDKDITLSSTYPSLKNYITGINILCILRFAKNCTRKNKDANFDHKIEKFDTRGNVRLYGNLGLNKALKYKTLEECINATHYIRFMIKSSSKYPIDVLQQKC